MTMTAGKGDWRFPAAHTAAARGGTTPGGRIACRLGLLALALGIPCGAEAGRVILRIQAGNPIEKEQRVEIKSSLPEGVRTNHILNLDGLELGYDVKSDRYFVHRELTLSPKQVVVYDVEIDDIWAVPPVELERLREHAARMAELLAEYPQHETALKLQQEIVTKLDRVVEEQAVSAIGPGVQPLDHIRAYDSSMEVLKRVRIDVGRLENLVLGTGQDPGGMYGEDTRSPKPERFLEASTAYTNTAVVRIVVENTSPTRKRTVPVRQDMPEEIREHDVVNADGLDLATDPDRGVAYVYKQTLELAPRERRTFNIVIRDKWAVNGPRIAALRATATDILNRVAARERFESIEGALRELMQGLDGVEAERGPETVDAQYVAFHRQQSTELDDIENKLNRIVMALPQIERTTQLGFRVKAPSAKTTWMIIYIILGFLALLSVVFFFRWFGKTKAEGAEPGAPPPAG